MIGAARRRKSGRAALAAAAALALSGCGPVERGAGRLDADFRGPVVLISFSALRADAIGQAESITPRLDRFVAGASWVGRGVAAAGWTTGSLASLMTGLPPSVTGVSHPAHPWLRPEVPTLAEELAAAGFATQAWYASPWSGVGFGLERGFAATRPLHRRAAERWLANLPEGPSLAWIDLPLPGSGLATALAGFEEETAAARQFDAAARQLDAASRQEGVESGTTAPRRRHAAARQKSAASRQAGKARRAAQEGGGEPQPQPSEVEPSALPSAPSQPVASPGAAPALDAGDGGYRARVADADRSFGRLVDALRRSGRWDDAVVIVLADHGEGGPGEAVAPGLAIDRSMVEVPLAIRVPDRLRDRLTAPLGAAVGLDRVRATVLELAGLRPRPATAPSLLRSGGWPALSELWFADGYHETGVYEDGYQLRWRCRFAAPETGFEVGWREALGFGGGAAYGDAVSRLQATFRARPGCSGGEEWTLEAWPESGGTQVVEDPARRDRLIERLRGLRRFPPVWATDPAPPTPSLGRRELLALSGWGLPLPQQWAANQ